MISGRMKKVLLTTVAFFLVLACVLLGQKQAVPPQHSVTLTWQAPPRTQGSAPLRYNVYRSDDAGRSYSLITGQIAETSYSDRTVESGRTYRYVVTSKDAAGHESVRCGPVIATIP